MIHSSDDHLGPSDTAQDESALTLRKKLTRDDDKWARAPSI